MGVRRASNRQRLYSLNKAGKTDSITSGAAAPSITRQTVRREGNKIVTEIAVNLGTNTSVASATDGHVIGKSAATTCTIATLSLATHGYITYAEIACLAAPAGGSADIDVVVGTASNDAQGASVTGAQALVASGGSLTLGARVAKVLGTLFDSGSPDAKAYLYLTNGASAGGGTYTAGKLLITLEGIASDAVPDSLSQ